MKRREIEQLLDRLVVDVPRAIRQAGLKPNACILAGRMATEGLRAKGVRARPLAVDLTVTSPEYARRWLAGERVTKENELEWLEAGAWIITVDHDKQGEGWSGHLVVIAEERYVLDLTASQFARPEKGIRAEAFWHESRELARGEPWTGQAEEGCLWEYRPRVGDRSFLRAPAWSGYRVSVRGGHVVSERTPTHGGTASGAPVAAEVRLPIV